MRRQGFSGCILRVNVSRGHYYCPMELLNTFMSDETRLLFLWHHNQLLNLILLSVTQKKKFIKIEYPKGIQKLMFSNFGKGSGTTKHRKRTLYPGNDLFNTCNTRIFEATTHMKREEFQEILQALPLFKSKFIILNLPNRLMLTFEWMIHYPTYSTLSKSYLVSEGTISQIIHETLPHLMKHFQTFIPNYKVNTEHSELHPNICFIIDGTYHPHVRRIHQHLYYRKDKGRHFVQTFLLIDYTGLIISFRTGVHGHLPDNVGVRDCQIFNEICQETNSFAISDSGFKNVNFIVLVIKPLSLLAQIVRNGIKLHGKNKNTLNTLMHG